MFADLIAEARRQYELIGLDAIPLVSNEKRPLAQRWQQRAPCKMWEEAPKDANIGLRCGGGLHFAVVDADDKNAPETSENVGRHLEGLGLGDGDYVLIATPSNGRHFCLRLAKTPNGNFRHLSRAIGAGEFRFGSGAQVAAPPSVIRKGKYERISGDYAHLPVVAFADLAALLPPNHLTAPQMGISILAAPRTEHTISRPAQELLAGFGIENYKSRSEAEFALILSLINTGHHYDSVLALFIQNPCAGKFAELYRKNSNAGLDWFNLSFERARVWAASNESEGRHRARRALEWAHAHKWHGRTASYDRAVFLAHARIAFETGRVIYAASCRTLGETSGVSWITAACATRRLRDSKYIHLVSQSEGQFAAEYELGEVYTLPQGGNGVRECINLRDLGHDAFRFQGFGKTAARILDHLKQYDDGEEARQVAQETGISFDTVEKHLGKMAKYGLVNEAEGVWYVDLATNLEDVAIRLQVKGLGERQRAQHGRQREQYRQRLTSAK